MRFVDEARIYVKGGDGGRGCVAFLRQKFRPLGGPSGGDGGDGGSVILEATTRASTLLDLKFNRHYRAGRGEHGGGSDRHGKNGDDRVISVPLGTMVYDDENSELLGDLVDDGQTLVIASGGMGGRGNARFATATNQAPRHAQPGIAGDERWIRLDLKLLADVGLVGFPNAGKSTLIRKVSHSRAKVASYPFTTLVPNLGVVPYDDDRSFVIADVPGLIEGASEGAGLGHQFLRHIERTRVLVVMVETLGEKTPGDAYTILMAELKKHEPALLERARIVCLNKCDLVDDETITLCLEELNEVGAPEVMTLSALSGQGTDQLIHKMAKLLRSESD
jgi:GTP-binding protein